MLERAYPPLKLVGLSGAGPRLDGVWRGLRGAVQLGHQIKPNCWLTCCALLVCLLGLHLTAALAAISNLATPVRIWL